PFTHATIAGHDVLLAAFHTSCHETCPLYTGLFLQLRRQLPPSVLLVEATTDPQEDTPDVLRAYAGRLGASWSFVTGSPEALAAFWKPFDGPSVRLADYRGHSLLINFWASWCVPCRTEMPLIQRMASQHPRLVDLLVDERDDPGAARAFVRELGIRSTVLLDEDGGVGD